MTNNKIRTKILELESSSQVKIRLKERGVISNEVSDNNRFGSMDISKISGVTTSKVIDRLGRTINTKQY